MRSAPLYLLPPLLFACSDPAPTSQSTPTYHSAVRPLLEANCTVCHSPGGIGPYFLDSYEDAKTYGPIALAAVVSGRMPPWMPSADCRPYQHERRVSDADIEVLRRWVEAGMPEGDPVTQDSAPLSSEPDIVLSPKNAYLPNSERPDDYHCFPLEHVFDRETFLVGTNVVPEHPELVHHVIVYLVLPQFAEHLAAIDAAEEGEGYTCFGGPGSPGAQNIGAWVPGSVPAMIDGDAAVRIPRGARLVMQMHYNTLAAEPVPETTKLHLWFTDEQPGYLINVRPYAHLGLQIPAGEPNVHESRLFTNTSNEPWIAGSVAAHMHLLGKRISMTAVHTSGEECIIDIPRWDFNWQQSYRFIDTVTIEPGESMRLDCWYDNSTANQPVINGTQLAPRRVTWGEGTLDEMCLGYLALIEPYAPLPEPAELCTSFQGCYDACVREGSSPKTACALSCSNRSGGGCTGCVIPGLVQCVLDDCPTIVGDTVECLEGCQGNADPSACVRAVCGGSLVAFDQCALPKMQSGACDAFVSACGTDL